MDPRNPIIEWTGVEEKYEEFGHQYKYYKEELDPFFPELIIDELKITIFCDSDHAHNLVAGRSITGLIVQTSTFGAEFTALKTAVELAITLRYTLQWKHHHLSLSTTRECMYKCNQAIALSYHFVRQHQAGKVVEIFHIGTQDNYADLLTKPLNLTALRSLLHEFMRK
jgi:hypothetical protein